MTKHSAPIETLEPAEVSRLLTGRQDSADRCSRTRRIRRPNASQAPCSIRSRRLMPPLLPDDGPRRVVFHCGSGKRSLTAAERRLGAGQPHAAHMGGGIAAWKAAGLPVISL